MKGKNGMLENTNADGYQQKTQDWSSNFYNPAEGSSVQGIQGNESCMFENWFTAGMSFYSQIQKNGKRTKKCLKLQ